MLPVVVICLKIKQRAKKEKNGSIGFVCFLLGYAVVFFPKKEPTITVSDLVARKSGEWNALVELADVLIVFQLHK